MKAAKRVVFYIMIFAFLQFGISNLFSDVIFSEADILYEKGEFESKKERLIQLLAATGNSKHDQAAVFCHVYIGVLQMSQKKPGNRMQRK